jgi:hypothetical protein
MVKEEGESPNGGHKEGRRRLMKGILWKSGRFEGEGAAGRME